MVWEPKLPTEHPICLPNVSVVIRDKSPRWLLRRYRTRGVGELLGRCHWINRRKSQEIAAILRPIIESSFKQYSGTCEEMRTPVVSAILVCCRWMTGPKAESLKPRDRPWQYYSLQSRCARRRPISSGSREWTDCSWS